MTDNVKFISDLHLGHKSILDFAGEHRYRNTPNDLTSIEDHDEWLVETINMSVNKRDVLWILGDVAFTREGLEKVKRIRGDKRLILGNHDKFPLEEYYKAGFNKIHGFLKYKGYWLSHCPIHPSELRGTYSVHGHIHHNELTDRQRLNYINVCVEPLRGTPLTLTRINEIMRFRKATGLMPDRPPQEWKRRLNTIIGQGY